ncbi:MAG: response regulator [Bacteroidetes bacterium]|nr:response regulator [Bacteroidota bacterium]
MNEPNQISLCLVEDDPEIGELLRLVIQHSPGFHCERVFTNGEAACAQLPMLNPDIVLLDIGLPDINGIECLIKLRSIMPGTDFVILSVLQDDDSLFNALKAGARGYLLKDTPPAELIAALHELRDGGAPMSPSIARRIVSSFHKSADSVLTDREQTILQQLCDGHDYQVIARALYISGHTVRSHIKNIYKKLEVSSRAEVVSKAMKDRLI